MKKNIILIRSLAFLMLICLILINTPSCSPGGKKVKAMSLMDGIKSSKVDGKDADNTFISSAADFSIELFKLAAKENKNSLISPVSVLLALSMTANGADGDTLSQMEKVLSGGMSIDDLNKYLYSYSNSLPSNKKSKLSIANSIWFRNEENRLKVEPSFLQKNADYYNAAAYSSPFDNQTLKDINGWVSSNTDGMIDSILDDISDDAVMYLINAVVFDAEWENIYKRTDIHDGTFTGLDGKKQSVEFMESDESYYIDDGKAQGFLKHYSGGSYSFAALLPNQGVDINDYLSGMSGESFLRSVKDANKEQVHVSLPKFSYDYSIELNDALKAMGMTKAFGGDADFSKMGSSSRGGLYIENVLHKTFISVDEKGTKAGAVTKVEMKASGAPLEIRTIRLDRPFIYAIIDNSTGIPVFIGKLMDIG